MNDRLLQARERLLEMATTRVPVILCGEKGLGKEALAHTVHNRSLRASGPFVRVNCYVIPRAQLAADLFGDGPDAVTPFTRAKRGTLHLSGFETFDDEACDRLIAVLANFDQQPADEAPRLVLSTEMADPEGPAKRIMKTVLENSSGLAVTLPPLRSRPEDIGLLAQHILQLYSPFYASRIKQVRSSLIDLFKQYPWPGNVRELERVIRRFLVLEDESAIRRELEEKIWHRNGRGPSSEPEEVLDGLKLGEIGKLAAHRAEARAIQRVLERTRWNKKAAAQELGVSYKSLLNKVRDYRLDN